MMQNDYWTIQSLLSDTSAFARAIGQLCVVSNETNLTIIRVSWPGTWLKHEINGHAIRLEAEHAVSKSNETLLPFAALEECENLR